MICVFQGSLFFLYIKVCPFSVTLHSATSFGQTIYNSPSWHFRPVLRPSRFLGIAKGAITSLTVDSSFSISLPGNLRARFFTVRPFRAGCVAPQSSQTVLLGGNLPPRPRLIHTKNTTHQNK